ncbi:MAG: iron ABC transporter permease [Desulfarculaceae bacterium]|nr:iron ABC transporter permease [Desulfarculaceae bacterium]MCF8072048.1 iron ABC transporter permease [Desulfarculaceae bacterium]MCF8101565.1 iron ABC transporter permease [Desulfarculaceae bacterium]MCF8115115.1 iron ABC transporter permease [Desulfarculaceae bacterium]
MRATPKNLLWVCLGLFGLLVVALLIGLGLGTVSLTPGQFMEWLGGELEGAPAIILGQLRLPRLLLAGLVGACLGLSGAVFQAMLRNPLAEPFILGVSGGAACGAVVAVLIGIAGLWGQSLLAFGGALGTVGLVLAIARRRGSLETSTLILSGVMINAFFTALIMFVISTTSDQKLHAILFWLYGDLAAANLPKVWLLLPVTVLGTAVIMFFAKHLNLLTAGGMAASTLGVAVERVKLTMFLVVSLLVGVTVSLSGLIGFVGLMVPHLVRMTLGHDHRLLLPASALFGASFLMLADTAARTIISPSSLPVGVVTAFLGAPFFVLLMARRGSRWW